jgi:hypothetical protein
MGTHKRQNSRMGTSAGAHEIKINEKTEPKEFQ